jgi:predicted nuclease with RNAse H fold
MKRYLGIDLGGCMSGTSAYCLIEGDGVDFTIIKNFKEPKHSDYLSCHKYLLNILLESQAYKIGVDAPLSIPRKLYDSSYTPLTRDAKGEVANPFLFRDTDYLLFKVYGLRPMPPAGDRIGRLTARIMQLLNDKSIDVIKDTIMEVYPKQIAQALGNVAYKKDPQWVLKRLGMNDDGFDEHQIDALLAAYATMMIDFGHTDSAAKSDDGYCYTLALK